MESGVTNGDDGGLCHAVGLGTSRWIAEALLPFTWAGMAPWALAGLTLPVSIFQ